MEKIYCFSKNCSRAFLFILLTFAIMPKQTNADIIGTDRLTPTINVFQDITWSVISSKPLALTGYTIVRAPSVTWNSDNLKFYIILRTTADTTSRRLATVNPATGVCTDIGDMGYNFSSLTYSATTHTLYAMGGTGSGAPNILATVDINTGVPTYLAGPFPLGTGGGAIIAYNYIDGFMYHWSGYPVSSMEKIDLNSFAVTPITMTGVSTSEVYGAVYNGVGEFIITDFDYKAFTVTEAGAVTLQQSGLTFKVRGLGYVDALLPVELSSFTSFINGRNVELNWETVNETNNSGFDIERSDVRGQTSDSWTKIGNVAGNGTSSNGHSYSFIDRNLASGHYSYRLKQIDLNGNFEYFNLSNEVNVGVPVKFDLSQNYPNPFNPSTNLGFGISELGFVSLKVYNASGKEVAALVNEVKPAGYYTINFNALGLSSGIYFYTLKANNFSSTKKMLLMK